MRATTPEARRYARWLFPTLSPLPPPPYMLRTPVQRLGEDGRFRACAAARIKKRPGVHLLPLEQAVPEGAEQSSLLKVDLQEVFRTAGFYTVSFSFPLLRMT